MIRQNHVAADTTDFTKQACGLPARSKVAVVYLLWAVGTTFFKIGYTTQDVEHRRRDIESACMFSVKLVGAIPGNMIQERAIHARFAQYQMRGEWFCLPESEAFEALCIFGRREEMLADEKAAAEASNGSQESCAG